VHRGANAWAVTPDGRFAIAWTDATALKADPSEGFQDITVLDLSSKLTSKRLSVGLPPARIFMDDDDRYRLRRYGRGHRRRRLESDMGPAESSREVPVSADPANDTAKREVNMTPDGAFAFVRREGKPYITVVSLARASFKTSRCPAS